MLIATLGRQPKLSLAELISACGSNASMVTKDCVLIDREELDLNRLGGTIKLGRVIMELPTVAWAEIARELPLNPQLLDFFKSKAGKITLGLSVYGQTVPVNNLSRLGLALKQTLRMSGRSARLVALSGLRTNSAQVQHNHLISKGADILIVIGSDRTWVGVTEQVQNIDSYAERDYGRPRRSAKIGMLPPKLAQVMINLARPPAKAKILDPFCGTGVILQEALLMGYGVLGSDLNSEMVDATHANLNWLIHKSAPLSEWACTSADATDHVWDRPFDAVVTEGYLGPPLSSAPSGAELAELRASAQRLTLDFLANLHPQLKPGSPICLTLPAWKQGPGHQRLDIVDQISALGYTMKQFSPVSQSDMLYYRPDQIVAREILVLVRT